MGHIDPQVEAGNFTRIHNAILEAIISTSFTAREQRVILWVLRHTYGFNKKATALDVKAIALALGIYPTQIKAVLMNLIEAGVLTVKNDTVGINKYTSRWTYGTATNQLQDSYKSATSQLQLVANAPENTSNDALLQTPKERKTERHEITPLPPQENEVCEGGSEVDLLPVSPRPRRPDQAWRDTIASVDFFPGEVDFLAEEFLGVNVPDGLAAVHPFKRPKLVAWLKHPRVARELAFQWAGAQPWAKNLFGAAGAYLENPGRFKDKEPEQAPARPERDLSGWRVLLKGQGGATDPDWLSFQADRARRGGVDVDPEEVRARCKAEGLAVAGPWLFDLLTSQRKATS